MDTQSVNEGTPTSVDPSAPSAATNNSAGLDHPRNYPIIIAVLYLLGFLFQPFAIVGFILCFVFNPPESESWVRSHLRYQMTTFIVGIVVTVLFIVLWFGMIGGLVFSAAGQPNGEVSPGMFGGFFMMFPLMMLGWLAWAVWTAARCIISIMKANNREALPNPTTLAW
jgi:uncharacterized membrane protein